MQKPDQLLEQLHVAGQSDDAAIALADTALILAALDHTGSTSRPTVRISNNWPTNPGWRSLRSAAA